MSDSEDASVPRVIERVRTWAPFYLAEANPRRADLESLISAAQRSDALASALRLLMENSSHARGCRSQRVDRRKKDADEFGFGPCNCGLEVSLVAAARALGCALECHVIREDGSRDVLSLCPSCESTTGDFVRVVERRVRAADCDRCGA